MPRKPKPASKSALKKRVAKKPTGPKCSFEGRKAHAITDPPLPVMSPSEYAAAIKAIAKPIAEKPTSPKSILKDLKAHPLADLLPMMSPSEFLALKEDLDISFQREPIILLDGMILDGRNRYRALHELGRVPEYADFDGSCSPIQYVYSKANHRNMDESQKAASAALFEPEFAKAAAKRVQAGAPVPPGQIKGRSRDIAASLFGVSPRYVQAAKAILNADRKLFDECHAGRKKITVATRELANKHKKSRMDKLAISAAKSGDWSKWEVRVGDNADILPAIPRKSVQLVFADPQYNIGVDYGNGQKADLLTREAYRKQCLAWMVECFEVLTLDGTMVVLINAENVGEFLVALKTIGFTVRTLITWYESFGVNCASGFTRSSRFLIHCIKDKRSFVFNSQIFNRRSDRQDKHKDKRANPNGRIWDDVWGINPAIPRLVENSYERVPGFPTQLPLALLLPVVQGFSEPGDTVLDPFSGSGTTGAACIGEGRKYLGIEQNKEYAEASILRLKGVIPF